MNCWDRFPGSFRDPAGFLVGYGNRMLRFVRPEAAADITSFLSSNLGRTLLEEGSLVRTKALIPSDENSETKAFVEEGLRRTGAAVILDHERVPFPSFPYEWPPQMLYAAADLTLDLAQRCLKDGFGLKDATPYNVLFRGARPLFIDALSFERREPGDPTWLAYGQFIRTCLLPLAVNRHYGVRLDQILTARRDGLEPEEVYRFLKARHKITPPFLSLVSIPKWLGARMDANDSRIYGKKTLPDREKAAFILETALSGLRRSLKRVAPQQRTGSVWSGYMRGGNTYSNEQFAAKHAFVERALEEFRPRRALDVGCNTGHFSLLAAEQGAAVVAIDQDPVVVGETWQAAAAKGSDVLPLAVDLCRPSPATGWVNGECPSFLERARGHFDCLMMLAVLHHMLVTERVPLERIVDLAAELTTDLAIVEFIAPEDPMFQRLLRGRAELHRDLSVELFESRFRERFDVVRSERLGDSSRWLYLLRRRSVSEHVPGVRG